MKRWFVQTDGTLLIPQLDPAALEARRNRLLEALQGPPHFRVYSPVGRMLALSNREREEVRMRRN